MARSGAQPAVRSEPGARPRGRNPGTPPGVPRPPFLECPDAPAHPGRNEGGMKRAGTWVGGGAMRAVQIPGDVIPAGATATPAREVRAVAGGPGPPAGRGGDPGAGPGRRMPAPRGVRGDGPPVAGGPGGRPPGSTQPTAAQAAMTQPRGRHDHAGRGLDRAARGPGGPRDSGGRRNSPRSRGPGQPRRWGALQGGLGVCIIVTSAAIGAIVTMVARSAPGSLLGFFVVAGTVAAADLRPRAGLDDLPGPGAFLPGSRPDKRCRIRPVHRCVQHGAGHRRGPVDRQRLLRDGARHGAGRRDHHRPLVSLAPRQASHAQTGVGRVPPAGPAGPARDAWRARPPRGAGGFRGPGYPAGFAGPGRPGESGEAGGPGVLWGCWGLGRPGLTWRLPCPRPSSSRAAPRSRTLQLSSGA